MINTLRPKRFLSLYLSNLSIARVGKHRDDKHKGYKERMDSDNDTMLPIVLYSKRNNQLQVVRVSEGARKHGIYEYLPLAVAQALCSDLLSYQYEPLNEFSLLQNIALWCLRISPIVGIDDEYVHSYLHNIVGSPLHSGLIIDLTGTERVHKGEHVLAESLISRFAQRGLSAQIGISSTIAKAWAHARFSKQHILVDSPDALSYESIAGYPIACLRLPVRIQDQLIELGVRTVESLFSLPRKSLSQRFGRELVERIEQVEGSRIEVIHVVSAPPTWSRKHAFDLPSNSSLEIASHSERLYASLFESLCQEKKIPRSINIELYSYPHDEMVWRKELFLFRRTSPSEFRNLLLSYLEKNRSCGNIILIRLSILHLEEERGRQQHFDKSASKGHEGILEGFLGAVSNKIGHTSVKVARLYDTHVPEESIGYEALASHSLHSPASNYHSGDIPERPSLFFHPGHPIKVFALLPDHPPQRIYLGKDMITLVRSIGPEKIEEPWFSLSAHSLRDYFRVCDSQGRWLWLCHHRESQTWTLCGIWT